MGFLSVIKAGGTWDFAHITGLRQLLRIIDSYDAKILEKKKPPPSYILLYYFLMFRVFERWSGYDNYLVSFISC